MSKEKRTPASSQTAVSSSISVTANVPKQFAEVVKQLHNGYNCKLKQYNDYKNEWITVEVQGRKKDIERLNKQCQQIAYDVIFNEYEDFEDEEQITPDYYECMCCGNVQFSYSYSCTRCAGPMSECWY